MENWQPFNENEQGISKQTENNFYISQFITPVLKQLIDPLIEDNKIMKSELIMWGTRFKTIESTVKQLQNNIVNTIDNSRMSNERVSNLYNGVKFKTKEIIKLVRPNTISDGALSRSIRNSIWWKLKLIFGVSSYTLISNKDFETAIKLIEETIPEEIGYTIINESDAA